MNRIFFFFICAACSALPAEAQVNAADSVMSHAGGHRLSVGGYGEVVLSRNFYSDNPYRYSAPAEYADDPSHGRFDIPHGVIYLGYDFGKGWTMGSEIEFEHTGTGAAEEREYEEALEWEQEVEKGGEVELEQFWLQKSVFPALNIKVGHIVVPVGLNNTHHEPLNFFTVYRPEGENTILPSTWHDTGISIWGSFNVGKSGYMRYEAQMVAGLDAMFFNRDNWVKKGAGSGFEFKVANKYGFAGRLDYGMMPGVRFGVSGYYGRSFHNTLPNDMTTGKYKNVKGQVAIGSVDFTYNRGNIIVRGQADYGYLSDATTISTCKRSKTGNGAPYSKLPVGKNAMAIGAEAGYDIFSQIAKMREDQQKLYIFARGEIYNPYIPAAEQYEYTFTKKKRLAAGLNYYPVPQIVVKGEYSYRWLDDPYNNEPSVNLGIAYEGFFF